jgi:PAS domain S-box-containing protein
VQDITKIKEIESRLENSEQKLRVMFESLVEGVIVCNHYGDIEDLNHAAMILHGFQDKEELMEQKFIYLVSIQDRTRVAMKLKYMLENRIEYQTECRCLRKDNSEFDAELSIVPMDRTRSESAFVVVSKDITESKQLRENMQFYISRMTMAQEDERRRIALDLHDDVAQSLLSLNLEFETLCRRTEFPSASDRRQFDVLQSKIRRTVEDVRYFIQELRPSVLDQFGLIASLEILTAELHERGIQHSHLKVMGYERRLSPDKELLLFRIAQEAINNDWKHSKATSCLISLSFKSKILKMRISDNGIGFEAPHSVTVPIKNSKIGIMCMHERAKLLNAKLSIESKLHEGTKVEVTCSI